MSNVIIDMEVLADRVQQHLGTLNLHHVSYVEVIKLLLDEMDNIRGENEALTTSCAKLLTRISQLEE